jgi:hypothetical protein
LSQSAAHANTERVAVDNVQRVRRGVAGVSARARTLLLQERRAQGEERDRKSEDVSR